MAPDSGGAGDWTPRLTTLAGVVRQGLDPWQAAAHAARAVRFAPAETAFVLAGGDGWPATLLAAEGPLATELGFSLSTGVLLFPEWLTQATAPVVMADLAADPRAAQLRQWGFGRGAAVVVPVRGRDSTLGALVLVRPVRGEPPEEDLGGLQAVAEMLGMTLEKQHLRETAEEQSRHLLALGQVSRLLVTEFDTKAVLTLIVDVVASRFNLDLCCLLLYDDAGKLRMRAARGLAANAAADFVCPAGEPPDTEPFRAMGFVSVVLHRVSGRGQVLGYLVAGCRAACPLDGSERSPLAVWASLAGVALEKSRWMERARAAKRDTIDALVAVLESQQPGRRVSVRTRAAGATALAGTMGMAEEECRDLYLAALLADAGICRPERCPLEGSASPRLQRVRHVLHASCERWDGGGPLGLRGHEIPLGARILAVVRAFTDALETGARCGPPSLEVALGRVRAEAGRSLDPLVVSALECQYRAARPAPALDLLQAQD